MPLNKDMIEERTFTIKVQEKISLDRGINTDGKSTTNLTFSGVPSSGETLSLKSYDSLSKTYTAFTSEVLTSRKFDASGTKLEAATSLKNCIESSYGHNGKILCEIITLTGGDIVLKLTQAVNGSDGDRPISNSLSNVSGTNFSGGFLNSLNPISVVPFALMHNSPGNIQKQSTVNYHKTFLGEPK